jgi:hypothetical protein
MSTTMSEQEKEQYRRELKKIEGKVEHIEVNDKTLVAYREEFGKKGLVITKESEYPREEFNMVAKQKLFDRLVDPKQGIRKVISSMVRQPITIFDKNGKPTVKDALYYNGYYYGNDKKGTDLGAYFIEGYYKKPKMSFVYSDATAPYDSKTGERRGTYQAGGITYEHYIILSEDQKERTKQLTDIIAKCPEHIQTL